MTEHTTSYYAASANKYEPFPTLEGSINCDVCVVGGGYTGLSSALHLAEMGYDVVVLEGARIGFGASGRNGGQLVNSTPRCSTFTCRVVTNFLPSLRSMSLSRTGRL